MVEQIQQQRLAAPQREARLHLIRTRGGIDDVQREILGMVADLFEAVDNLTQTVEQMRKEKLNRQGASEYAAKESRRDAAGQILIPQLEASR